MVAYVDKFELNKEHKIKQDDSAITSILNVLNNIVKVNNKENNAIATHNLIIFYKSNKKLTKTTLVSSII